MGPDVQSIEDEVPGALCPIEMLRDVVDTFKETAQVLADGLSESSAIPSSFGRSLASVIEANGVLFEQLSDVARRFEPGAARRSAAPRTGSATSATSQTVVLAAGRGGEASGAFALQNLRPEAIRATVLPTTFVDLAGDHVAVELRLDPSRVVLEPGEEVVVSVVATIPGDLAPGQQLQGAIHVPGLTTSMVPVILRSE